MRDRRFGMSLWGRCWMAALLCALAVLAAACGKKTTTLGSDGQETTQEPDDSVVLKDDTEGFTLTWIDDKGDFHIAMKVEEVPMVGKDVVRVLDPEKTLGRWNDPQTKVFVADLRGKRDDGSYPVTTMAKRDFEDIAVKRREKRGLLTMASAAASRMPTAPSAARQPQETETNPNASARANVIIYGAEWCGACHQAMAYLAKKGVPAVEKDIDNDPDANREMREKLARARKHSGSIPVLDVRGKILVGFDPQEVDEALGRAM